MALARDRDRRAQEGQIQTLNEELDARKRAEHEKGILLEMRQIEMYREKFRMEMEKRRMEEDEEEQ